MASFQHYLKTSFRQSCVARPLCGGSAAHTCLRSGRGAQTRSRAIGKAADKVAEIVYAGSQFDPDEQQGPSYFVRLWFIHFIFLPPNSKFASDPNQLGYFFLIYFARDPCFDKTVFCLPTLRFQLILQFKMNFGMSGCVNFVNGFMPVLAMCWKADLFLQSVAK